MKIYVINYTTWEMLRAEQDDPSFQTMEDLGSPAFAAVADEDALPTVLQLVRSTVIEEVSMEYNDNEEFLGPMPDYEWQLGEFSRAFSGARRIRYDYLSTMDDAPHPLAIVVIQEAE